MPPLSPTEQRNPLSHNLDALSPLDLARLINRLDADVPLAVAECLPQIAQVIKRVGDVLANGGRLFYLGAGTSGRLAVLDAVELVPTFGIDPTQVVGLIAGGAAAMMRSVEGAEDDAEQGRRDLAAHNFSARDALIGVAASGRTPYVAGGLGWARESGAFTAAVACNPGSAIGEIAEVAIEVVVGPEVLTGSTRLRAGTAQKLVLNTISTGVMVRLGKVYENLMIDVQPTNAKLRERAVRIVATVTDESVEAARSLLDGADWQVKTAVVMGLVEVGADEARRRLTASGGRVRGAIGRG